MASSAALNIKTAPPTSPYSLASLPCPDFSAIQAGQAPDEAYCRALWKKYSMLEHISRHSRLVADLACAVAEKALEKGAVISVPHVRASALLHDIAKTYTIKHGGSHAQLGAAWVVFETHNYAIAQGVMHHVCWPWEVTENNVCSLPFFVIYADKRVRHDALVSLEERFSDLLQRYGHTEQARQGIRTSHAQGRLIERLLSEKIGLDLGEYTLNNGKLAARAAEI